MILSCSKVPRSAGCEQPPGPAAPLLLLPSLSLSSEAALDVLEVGDSMGQGLPPGDRGARIRQGRGGGALQRLARVAGLGVQESEILQQRLTTNIVFLKCWAMHFKYSTIRRILQSI